MNTKTEAESVADLVRAGERAARKPESVEAFGRQFLSIPVNGTFDLRDLTINPPLPDHIKQGVTVDDRESFCEYLKRYQTDFTAVFASYHRDVGGCMFIGILDYHGEAIDEDGVPARCAHRVTFNMQPSEEWRRWSEFARAWQTQTDFAEFLEENAIDIKRPVGGEILELVTDLDAKRAVTWKSQVRLDTKTRTFEYDEQVTATGKGKGQLTVPRDLLFAMPLFDGEPAMELTAFLRHKISDGGLTFKLDWFRLEYVRRALLKQTALQIVEACGSVPLFWGAPK